MTDTFTMDCEYTDTFGGQANYCWVRRAEIELPVGISDRAMARRVKAALGITGLRGRSYRNGDTWEFRPHRMCTVVFANVRY